MSYQQHEFQPRVNFPIIINTISPDIKTHIGSPEYFIYSGFGIKVSTEIQINRNIVIYSTIGKSVFDNFDKKVSRPNTRLSPVRTEIVDYLQQSSEDFYLTNLNIESIHPIHHNLYAKINFGYLEYMYGGLAAELLYKPFKSNFAFSLEYNQVKKRDYNQKFSFLDYEATMPRINVAYYHPQSNILTKWSYGKYLARDTGYTLDISRRMPSGWNAGFFFSQTNVSAEQLLFLLNYLRLL